jgi:hypothetical protein
MTFVTCPMRALAVVGLGCCSSAGGRGLVGKIVQDRIRHGVLDRRLPRRRGYSLGTATRRHPCHRWSAPVGGSLGGQGTRATSHFALPSTAPRRPTPALGRRDLTTRSTSGQVT